MPQNILRWQGNFPLPSQRFNEEQASHSDAAHLQRQVERSIPLCLWFLTTTTFFKPTKCCLAGTSASVLMLTPWCVLSVDTQKTAAVLFSVGDRNSFWAKNIFTGLCNLVEVFFFRHHTVATSPVVLRWLCDSPRTGSAWRTKIYMRGACHGAKLCAHAARDFRSHQHQLKPRPCGILHFFWKYSTD